jgi:epoxide hydrolase-like predicted phosphatase
MMKEKLKAVIFDMGGVILRTCDESPRIQLAARMGITVEQLKNEVFFSESAIKSEEGDLDKYAHWKNVLNTFGIKADENLMEYDEKFWSGDCVDRELVNYLKLLKKSYLLGFISNAFKGAREWIERHYHFMDIFDYSIFSYEIKMRKPDPRIYLHACRNLKVKPHEAVFIDDMKINVDGAKAAGLFGIQYKNKKHLAYDLNEVLARINDPHDLGN